VGTRHYYRKLGYELEGPYMVKSLLGLLDEWVDTIWWWWQSGWFEILLVVKIENAFIMLSLLVMIGLPVGCNILIRDFGRVGCIEISYFSQSTIGSTLYLQLLGRMFASETHTIRYTMAQSMSYNV
jgi:hypothetical protein